MDNECFSNAMREGMTVFHPAQRFLFSVPCLTPAAQLLQAAFADVGHPAHALW